jgi:NAD(P)-dependent dehydrogenase (short-subunit alcohol dehydrogenase family)
MDARVSGLRVIVTAGAAGIGRSVFVCDVSSDAVATMVAERPGIRAVVADVSDEVAVDAFIDEAVEALDGVDVLVNNAGIAGPGGRLEDLDLDAWRQTLDVNVTGMFLTSRRVIPHLIQQRSGSIVNLSSTAGLFGFPYRAPYAASKWAVIGLTKTMAMELGEFGIRVNAICPGSVNNERMDRVVDLEAAASGRPAADIRAGFTKAVSLQTFIDPQDIAAMVRFICSPAGARISGQALTVDGHTESART